VIVVHFRSGPELSAWLDSGERAALLAEADRYAAAGLQVHRPSGLAGWFTLPGTRLVKAPPRVKMAIATWIGILPLLLPLNLYLAPAPDRDPASATRRDRGPAHHAGHDLPAVVGDGGFGERLGYRWRPRSPSGTGNAQNAFCLGPRPPQGAVGGDAEHGVDAPVGDLPLRIMTLMQSMNSTA
jgi:hypothetical protein